MPPLRLGSPQPSVIVTAHTEEQVSLPMGAKNVLLLHTLGDWIKTELCC